MNKLSFIWKKDPWRKKVFMNKKGILLMGLYLTFLVFNCSQQTKNDFPILKGPYLGQKPPGKTPEVFAPGIVSTESVELNSVFMPDNSELYFTRKTPEALYVIMMMNRKNGLWTKPVPASFSGVYEEADPFITSNGKQLLYISKKPLKGLGPPHDILILNRNGDEWSKPYNPGLPLNTEHNEIYPCLTAKGSLYFNSNRPGGYGKRDIYKSEYINGKFSEPENLGGSISTEYDEGDIFVPDDESYLIFVSRDRPDSLGSGDLYICFKSKDGKWTVPINMGETINAQGYDYGPIVTQDKKYFFYTRNNDIYWVDAKILDSYKPDELKDREK